MSDQDAASFNTRIRGTTRATGKMIRGMGEALNVSVIKIHTTDNTKKEKFVAKVSISGSMVTHTMESG
jgi:hypothetical protein